MRGVLIVLGVALALGGIAPPQAPTPASSPSAEFTRLFNQYRTGDADAAVLEFSSWDRVRIEREAVFDVPGDDLRAKSATTALSSTWTARRRRRS